QNLADRVEVDAGVAQTANQIEADELAVREHAIAALGAAGGREQPLVRIEPQPPHGNPADARRLSDAVGSLCHGGPCAVSTGWRVKGPNRESQCVEGTTGTIRAPARSRERGGRSPPPCDAPSGDS